MVTKQFWLIPLTVLTIATASGSVSARGNTGSMPTSPTEVPKRSILFVANAGQWPEATRFQVWGSPAGVGTTWLTEDEIWISIVAGSPSTGSAALPKELPNPQLADIALATPSPTGLALKLTFPGNNPDVHIEPFDPLTTTISYFLGNDPAQWYPGVMVYGGVRYADLYPGVDLVLQGQDSFWQLEVGRGAETSPVRLRIEGADGATLDGDRLHLTTAAGILALALPTTPLAFQVEVVGPQASLEIFDLPPNLLHSPFTTPLAPEDDPADLFYSTYLGGGHDDQVGAMALDDAGRTTVVGTTVSSDFPTTPGAFDPSFNWGNHDVFVVRLNAAGSALNYATFLGGSGGDGGNGLALDSAGRATMTGSTTSSDFPVTPGAFCPSYGDSQDAFVARLSADGSALIYSTFLGGSNYDGGYAITVDGAGLATVAGDTGSYDFPTSSSAFDPSYNGGWYDAFVARLSADGSALVYGTFLGGSDGDIVWAITVDSTGRSTVAGITQSSDFPTTVGAFDLGYGGSGDAFIARLSADGSALVYSTFLGGSGTEVSFSIAVDSADQTTAAGVTGSTDFPTTTGAYDTSHNGGHDDAFIVRLSAEGNFLIYSTFLGGSSYDGAEALTVDNIGRAIVTGTTQSRDFPVTPDAFDTRCDDTSCQDAFIASVSADGSALVYSTFLGGSRVEGARGISSDSANRVIVAGDTASSDFPTTLGTFDSGFNGSIDAFVSRLEAVAHDSTIALIEQPCAGAWVTGTVIISGFAIDLGSPTGTGIDRVHIYLDGPYGTGTIIGGATYGLDRPDIAAQYGARFGLSGWELAWDTSTAAPGVHSLYLYAHRTIDNRWSLMTPRLVVVRADHVCWLPLGAKN